ncbi:MAG: extracellular solute-binding protein [Alphaproteobacteria bacterium]|nr:extracellular solute-binding protein [Alphaproteobacteria bacterium]
MRRSAIAAAWLAASISALPALADDAAVCQNPQETHGFKTCADIAKAEAEGEVVIYATDPEAAEQRVLAAFTKAFPKIKTNYVRLQAGALYAKVLAERQAQSYLVDAMQLSDMGMVLDFQKRGGYIQYVSPEMSGYKAEAKSTPEGFWTWGAMGPAGIAYNPKVVTAADAPKTWQDVLDPKWADAVSVKVSNSGLQHDSWFELRKLYGAEYWKKFAELKPRAFDSYVQQYDRLVNQQDKIIHTAQYSGYLEWKAKGAPVAFVAPADGLPATPETWGLVANAPHPNAARLYMDWFLSVAGQQANSEGLFLHSMRPDAPPPPGGEPITKLKLLLPAEWPAFLSSRVEFQREWDKITGLR